MGNLRFHLFEILLFYEFESDTRMAPDLEKPDAFEVKLDEDEAVVRQEHFLQVLRHLHTQMTHMWSYQVDTQ